MAVHRAKNKGGRARRPSASGLKAKARTLKTPRLLLRPLTLPDAAPVQILFPHWDIVRYLTTDVSGG